MSLDVIWDMNMSGLIRIIEANFIKPCLVFIGFYKE